MRSKVDLAALGKFTIILADPPWSYNDLGHTRRIDNQYSIMSLDDICKLDVPSITRPDALLFLWCTATLLIPNAEKVINAWGFTYKTNIVWDKQLLGMGHYTRVRHEHLLLATKGKPGISAVHDLPSIISSRRGAHSVKPALAYEYVELMYPGRTKIELFARSAREGWVAWGDEAPIEEALTEASTEAPIAPKGCSTGGITPTNKIEVQE